MKAMTAGPRMTTNMAGKMQPTRGKSILIGALAAISSALCRRLQAQLLRLDGEYASDLAHPVARLG